MEGCQGCIVAVGAIRPSPPTTTHHPGYQAALPSHPKELRNAVHRSLVATTVHASSARMDLWFQEDVWPTRFRGSVRLPARTRAYLCYWRAIFVPAQTATDGRQSNRGARLTGTLGNRTIPLPKDSAAVAAPDLRRRQAARPWCPCTLLA